MQPEGSGPLNTSYFSSIESQIQKCTSAADLQALVTKAFASIQAQVSGISSQAAAIENLANSGIITQPSASFTSILSWIQTLTSAFLGPAYAAYAVYVLKLAEMPTQLASLTSAATAQAEKLGCSVTVPTIPIPTLPSLPPLP